MTNNIDIVVTWVDGSDEKWLSEKEKYQPTKKQDGNANRYRDWDILKFWFRGIEKFAPWVHKIYFVTWGHVPAWLDINNSKIAIVNHRDYIPTEYLPTFSSRTIELNLHRIPGLSEQFIYFNDDMFLLKPVKKNDFFKNNLPCQMSVLRPISFDQWTLGMYTRLNELIVIGNNFNKRKVIKNNFRKFFSFKYGKYIFENIDNMLYSNFTGFRETHAPSSFLKSTFSDVWDNAFDILDVTCRNRFRSMDGVNPWLMKDWQICSGSFEPRNDMTFSETLTIGIDDKKISKVFDKSKNTAICISDDVIDVNFKSEKQFIQEQFMKILPYKSSFEK